MSPTFTRRRALAATAAAALGIGAPACAMSAPIASAAASAAAAALREELCRLSSAYRRACREAEDAADRVEYPDPPEAVYARPGDRILFMRQPGPSWSYEADGRNWWADYDIVERLRGASFAYLSGRQDVHACARRDEVVAAVDAWRAADRAAEDVAGYTTAQDALEAAGAAYQAFRLRLVELRTSDPEVLTVKALALVDLRECSAAHLDTLIAQTMERMGRADETAFALSMARDFIGMLGAAGLEAMEASDV